MVERITDSPEVANAKRDVNIALEGVKDARAILKNIRKAEKDAKTTEQEKKRAERKANKAVKLQEILSRIEVKAEKARKALEAATV